MNWSRGFFRAWMVFALLWTAGTALSFYNHWPQRWEYDPPASQPGGQPNYFDRFDPRTPTYTFETARRVHISEHASIALVPLLVLACGLVMRWVLRGFKSA